MGKKTKRIHSRYSKEPIGRTRTIMLAKFIDLREIKRFAHEELKSHPILRELILMEPDKVEVHELLGKVPIWLKLARMGR